VDRPAHHEGGEGDVARIVVLPSGASIGDAKACREFHRGAPLAAFIQTA